MYNLFCYLHGCQRLLLLLIKPPVSLKTKKLHDKNGCKANLGHHGSINVKLLGLFDELDWPRECATLQKNLALGDAKHRRQVRDLFADVRQVRLKDRGLHFDLPPLT